MFQRVADVDSREAARCQESGAVLVGVREDDEWAGGHAPEAVDVPLVSLKSGMPSRASAGRPL